MQIALDSQRNLYFEMENVIGAIAKLLQNSDRPDQALISINSIIRSSMKLVKDAESSSKAAYSQLLSSRKPSDCIEIDKSNFPDWKCSLKLSGQELFDLEICLSDLLSSLLAENPLSCAGKIRDSCSRLLKIGIQLPLTSTILEPDILSPEEKRIIMMNIKSTVKNEVKEILHRVSTERRNMLIEQSLMHKEIESKVQDLNMLEIAVNQLRQDIGQKASKVKESFKNNLLKPFDDIWSVYTNIDQTSAIQLYFVFNKQAEKIKEFIDFFITFQF